MKGIITFMMEKRLYSKTSTEFKDIKRSRFNSDALFTTTMEPYAKNGGIVNSYQKGYSVQQYWPYRIGAD